MNRMTCEQALARWGIDAISINHNGIVTYQEITDGDEYWIPTFDFRFRWTGYRRWEPGPFRKLPSDLGD